MTILKGAPAAALYGSRAKDGVIMITTKTRGKGKGIGVTYNINYTDEAHWILRIIKMNMDRVKMVFVQRLQIQPQDNGHLVKNFSQV